MELPHPLPLVGATPISISLPTLLIEVVIFLGMVWLMEKLVFTPIRTAWREREQNIQAGLQASSEVRNEAEEAREEVRAILTAARRQAQGEIDEVSAEGEALRQKEVEEATAEFHRLVESATNRIQSEQEQAAGQMKDLVVDLALEAAGRVTGQSYRDSRARELAASVVDREGTQ